MKRRNFNKSILQRGGLMIEALAMLGLIAVVTPTMYKKSAERTMEVEDINTAATIRTITAAANDYVSANYSTILGDMIKNGEHNRRLNIDDLEAYLPYGFDISHALYNYDGANIQLSVSRPEGSNNLTTLMLFPARMDENDGIGQERTSRIAALIGSNGGYVTDTNKARGIGGIWELSGEDYTKNFNSANKYSIVTASADTISASAGNEMDYTKYLQRGKDAGDDEGQWKNTMRTDLYMGGPDTSTEDVYHDATGPWSIRNIKSLIVGANTSGGKDGDGKDLADVNGYGLYISGDAGNPNKNAYIHGSLIAAGQLFKADTDSLNFGRYTIADNGNAAYHFSVDTAGNTRADGSLTNLMDVNLASKLNDDGTGPAWSEVKIGALKKIRSNIIRYLISGNTNTVGDRPGKLSIMAGGYDWFVDSNGDLKRVSWPQYRNEKISKMFPVTIGANTRVEGLLSANMIDTQKLRIATLEAGSGYIDDANKWLRADKYGVLIQQIDLDNPNISRVPNSTRVNFENNRITLGIGTNGTDTKRSAGLVLQNEIKTKDDSTKESIGTATLTANKDIYVEAQNNVNITGTNNVNITGTNNLAASGKTTLIQASKNNLNDTKDNGADLAENTLLLRNDDMQMKMLDKQLTISGRNNDTDVKTVFNSGAVDLSGANLNVTSKELATLGSYPIGGGRPIPPTYSNRMVFSVRTNRNANDPSFKNNFENDYNITMHGNILVGNSVSGLEATSAKTALVTLEPNRYYLSIGKYKDNAGINIVPIGTTSSRTFLQPTLKNEDKNVLYMEQGATDANNNFKNADGSYTTNTDAGTIYIRKGYVEVRGEDETETTLKAPNAYGGKGVLVASRLVANNPSADKENTTVPYGHEVPQMFSDTVMENYGENAKNRYDTYMVNPAYTSVMHDIKLTTRGGARLSDILPDFINKGIYVVNNTYEEKAGDELDFYRSNWNDLVGKYTSNTGNITLGESTSWASPYLGSVPAPQCPPGYGRVITLTPSIFEMGQVGNLYKSNETKFGYYVLNSKVSTDQIETALTPAQYERTAVSPSTSSGAKVSLTNSANPTLNGDYNIKSMDNISTSKYVLSHIVKEDKNRNEIQPLAPVTFQQSTHLKSLTIPLATGSYTQGWATIMGFIYPESLYKGFIDAGRMAGTVKKSTTTGSTGYESTKNYWNIFPVKRGSLQGYATVYCYFDRTNILDKVVSGSGFNGQQKGYIDGYTYMQSMGGSDGTDIPSDYHKKSGSTDYQQRLNDPNMKYDEVW